jgi:tetraacyldisaccharide-1-P 4'-kinase
MIRFSAVARALKFRQTQKRMFLFAAKAEGGRMNGYVVPSGPLRNKHRIKKARERISEM